MSMELSKDFSSLSKSRRRISICMQSDPIHQDLYNSYPFTFSSPQNVNKSWVFHLHDEQAFDVDPLFSLFESCLRLISLSKHLEMFIHFTFRWQLGSSSMMMMTTPSFFFSWPWLCTQSIPGSFTCLPTLSLSFWFQLTLNSVWHAIKVSYCLPHKMYTNEWLRFTE